MSAELVRPALRVLPPEGMKSFRASGPGIEAQAVLLPPARWRETSLVTSGHFLCYSEHSRRTGNETRIDGRVTRFRDMSGRFHFIPAGCGCTGWSEGLSLYDGVYVFLDLSNPALDPEIAAAAASLNPIVASNDPAVVATARKLKAAVQTQDQFSSLYTGALYTVLAVELIRLQHGGKGLPQSKGGLAPHHLRRVQEYIEENLGADIRLNELAALTGLSPSHFCRAFKESVGMPPHRWQTLRRLECAKTLLATEPDLPAAIVAQAAGFGGPSQFTRTFRKFTGLTPLHFRALARGGELRV